VTRKFLIEVPHEESRVGCARVVDIFLTTGSHFLSRADWGCRDGVHKAWMVVDVHSKDEARGIVPPAFRAQAKVVELNCFTVEEIKAILEEHDHSS
jgi:hypothetical protein